MSQAAQPPPAGSLVVSFIDVRRGDAVLLQLSGKSYLRGADKLQEGANVVNFLKIRGIYRLYIVVASNPTADCVGSFLKVFALIKSRRATLLEILRRSLPSRLSAQVRDEGSLW
jgi:beta-lactamase superfamily II metal-dependent hydrolase